MSTNNSQLLIYTPLITSRISYIFHFIFDEILGIEYTIVTNIDSFKQSNDPKIAYVVENTWPHSNFFEAHPLLHEMMIKNQEIDISEYQNYKIFFKTSEKSILPFDLFAASFYLVTRYEEYLPYHADQFNRFPASESLAFKNQFLEEPIINQWCIILKNRLITMFPTLDFKTRSFKFISTIDIDNAYAHLHKGIVRTFLSGTQLLVMQPSKLLQKINVLRRKIQDPYDNYEYLFKTHQTKNIETIYFILFSKYGKYDKNLNPKNKTLKSLVKKISSLYPVGLHPSYASNKNFEILKNEKAALESLMGKQITKSRQHFLKMKLPDTYENLAALGIEEDYSMGYPEKPGFRAGTCSPFNFFNLKTNQTGKLKIFPFAIMDVTFKDYLGESTSSALIKIKKIISSIQKVDGLFISLWHNESLNPSNDQFSWRYVYERMLDRTKNGS